MYSNAITYKTCNNVQNLVGVVILWMMALYVNERVRSNELDNYGEMVIYKITGIRGCLSIGDIYKITGIR